MNRYIHAIAVLSLSLCGCTIRYSVEPESSGNTCHECSFCDKHCYTAATQSGERWLYQHGWSWVNGNLACSRCSKLDWECDTALVEIDGKMKEITTYRKAEE